MYCTKCNDLICTKCQFSTHKDHNDESTIVDIETYIEQAAKQFGIFKEKFRNFIKVSTTSFPIDDTVFEYISKQKGIIDVLYEEQKKFVLQQFDIFQQKIEKLKKVELDNLLKFKEFFKNKFSNMENKIDDLVNERSNIEEFIEERERDLTSFTELDIYAKESAVRRIPTDINILKNKKQIIMNLFKEYQKNIGDSDKIKRYFQRAIVNLKENKAYDLIKIIEKLIIQLENKYSSINLDEYMSSIVLELDEYALMNSRNNAPKHIKDILIACFNSKKVLDYNVTNNSLTVIEAEFKNTKMQNFLNFSRSININGILFVNGGWDDNKKLPLNNHLSFDFTTAKVTEEQSMLYGHSAHSLLYVPPMHLYVVSGSATGKCERQDLNTKIWEEIPELNFHRQNCSLFYYNEQYLYLFGGLCWDDISADFIFVETVERLDISYGPLDENSKWEIVPTLKTKDNVAINKSVMTVVPYSSSKILLVGGMFKDQSYSDDVVLFDFDKLEFSLLEDLKLEKKSCFPNKYFLFFGDFAYQFDNEGDIHEFGVKDLTFKVVNQHRPVAI